MFVPRYTPNIVEVETHFKEICERVLKVRHDIEVGLKELRNLPMGRTTVN